MDVPTKMIAVETSLHLAWWDHSCCVRISCYSALHRTHTHTETHYHWLMLFCLFVIWWFIVCFCVLANIHDAAVSMLHVEFYLIDSLHTLYLSPSALLLVLLTIFLGVCLLCYRDFLPRGSGIVTRRPLVLQLMNCPTGKNVYGGSCFPGRGILL